MKLPKYNLAYNTRDQLQLLAINASERKYDVGFNQAQKILKHGIISILKKIRSFEQLRFTQRCIKHKLTTKKIFASTKNLGLKERQRHKLESVIIKNIRKDLYKELSFREKEKSSAYREVCKLLNFNEITEYDKVLQKEKDFAIQHTKLYYTQRFNRIREMKDKRKPYV